MRYSLPFGRWKVCHFYCESMGIQNVKKKRTCPLLCLAPGSSLRVFFLHTKVGCVFDWAGLKKNKKT